jgi:SAM-dependent methyltransferase
VLNDRSATRADEERLYQREAPLPEPPPEVFAVAAEQWQSVKRLLPAERKEHPAVLDIGCGSGFFLQAAMKDGATVQGVEIDPRAVARCERFGVPVIQGSIFDVGVPAGSWDLITLWDVLEHLDNPLEALRMASRELAPGGVMVVRGRNGAIHTPAYALHTRLRDLARRLRIPNLSIVHRWGITPSGYASLLRQAGLQEVRLRAARPTRGDRHRALGSRVIMGGIKRVILVAVTLLRAASLGRIYPFASVVAVGRRGAS